jgi:imidazole glycerol phosphate synthase glutamine amidotransferase subunit
MPSKEVIVIDYGFGNVRSVINALEAVGLDPQISSDPEEVSNAPNLLLPGVGAFSSAMQELSRRRLAEAIHNAVSKDARLLGICLGMQLLFETSDEFGFSDGLGILQGHVGPLVSAAEVSPLKRATHIGWRQVTPENNGHLSNVFRVGAGEYYFVHSFAAQTQNDDSEIVAGRAHHLREPFVAAVEAGNVLGVQFHPERSGRAGLNLLAGIFRPGSGP